MLITMQIYSFYLTVEYIVFLSIPNARKLGDEVAQVVATLHNLLEIGEQAQAETPDAQPQNQADGEDDAGHDVATTAVEWRGVGLREDDGQLRRFAQYHGVATVGKFFHKGFHALADFLDAVVGAVAEEHVEIVGGKD